MIIEQKIWATAIVGITGAALSLARRWNSQASDAGHGVAGWAMAIIVLIWLFD